MKVAYVSENFPPYSFGGGELSAFTLAKYLASDHEFKVYMVTKKVKNSPAEEIVDNIHIYRVIPEGISRLPEDIRRGEILSYNTTKHLKPFIADADIIHTLSMRVTVGAYKAAKKNQIPLLGTVNDTWATCYYSLHFKNDRICWNCSQEKLRGCMAEYGGNKLALPYLKHNMRMRAEALKKFDCLLPRSKLVEEILHKNGFSNRMEPGPG